MDCVSLTLNPVTLYFQGLAYILDPLVGCASQMSLLSKLPDPTSGFFSSRRGVRHRDADIDESSVRQKIVGILEDLVANPDSLQGYANELTDFFMEQKSINSMVKECSRSCQKLILRVSSRSDYIYISSRSFPLIHVSLLGSRHS